MRRHGTSGCWEERLRQLLGCLAYDLKLANHRVLPVRGGDENITTHQDVALDFFDRVQNMREIKGHLSQADSFLENLLSDVRAYCLLRYHINFAP